MMLPEPLMTPVKLALAVPSVFWPLPKPMVSVLTSRLTVEPALTEFSEAMAWLAPRAKLPTPASISMRVRPLSVGRALETLAFTVEPFRMKVGPS